MYENYVCSKYLVLKDAFNENLTGTVSFRGNRRLGLDSKLNAHIIYSASYAFSYTFSNILSQQMECQDKDEFILQNYVLKKRSDNERDLRKDSIFKVAADPVLLSSLIYESSPSLPQPCQNCGNKFRRMMA